MDDLKKLLIHPKIKKNIGQNVYEWSSIDEINNFGGSLSVALEKVANYIKIYNQSQS